MGLGRRVFACLIASLLVSAGVSSLSARAQSAPDDPGFEFQWGFPQIGVAEAWAVGRGRGISVAVLDTGVDLPHEDLVGRLLSGGSDTHGDEASPQDDNGEGTHVTGIIAAATNNGTGVAGIAHEAKVLPIKVLDSDGDGFDANIREGIALAIERKVEVLLVNLDEDTILADAGIGFEDSIRAAWNAGIVPVIPADHRLVRSSVFSDAPALVVGGVTRQGTAGSYNVGIGSAGWGISAPGGTADGDQNDIFSTYLPGTRRDGLGGTRDYGRYIYEAGNVQAAAHVAGAAAILRGLGQTPQQTVERILSSATDVGAAGRDRTYGAGTLHIGRSVRGIPAQPAGSTAGGSPTSAPTSGQGGGGSGTTGSGGSPGPTGQPGRPAATGLAGTLPAAGGVGTPAGADQPGGPNQTSIDGATGEAGDIVGGLAASESPEDMPGRTPLLPLVAFLLVVGSAAITWALRHRTLEPRPPINSP